MSPSVPAVFPCRACQPLGGILDHGDSVFGAGLEDRVHIGALAIEVDHDQRLGEAIHRGPLSQGAGQDIGIQVQVARSLSTKMVRRLVDDSVGGRNGR